ncbi:MAG: ThuA domain-containing protein [Flavobacteriaceae bacterium]
MGKHILLFLFGCMSLAHSQDMPKVELTSEWVASMQEKISEVVPIPVFVKDKRKVLIFSLHTGFEHWVIPHTRSVMTLLAERSGAFEVEHSMDIGSFEAEMLQKYDVVVLNNNCPERDHRNLFWDVLKEDTTLTKEAQWQKARELEANLLEYVAQGGGIMLLHGAITMHNMSTAFSEMVGGSFDYHPKQQRIHVKPVDSNHPLVAGFKGKGFSHVDEPYFFKNAYTDLNFRPLLYMESKLLEGLRETPQEHIHYIAWIKKYGKGRLFYSSASHNAQSYENTGLLTFLLDGLRYTSGILECDDSPIGR